MIRLTGNQVRMLHRDLIVETGGTDGVRDEGLLFNCRFKPLTGRRYIPPYSRRPPAYAVHW